MSTSADFNIEQIGNSALTATPSSHWYENSWSSRHQVSVGFAHWVCVFQFVENENAENNVKSRSEKEHKAHFWNVSNSNSWPYDNPTSNVKGITCTIWDGFGHCDVAICLDLTISKFEFAKWHGKSVKRKKLHPT